MTFGFIEAEKASFPISRMCRALGVSQSGFFARAGNGLFVVVSSKTWSIWRISERPSACRPAPTAVPACDPRSRR